MDNSDLNLGKTSIRSIKTQLAISTALASVVLLNYGGRKAHANCDNVASGTYLCSGYTTTTQGLVGMPLTVTTADDFQIITAFGDALNLNGKDGLSFTDNNVSTITGASSGIQAMSSGALAITVTGAVTGQDGNGIHANSFGAYLTIEAASVEGSELGIRAWNYGSGALSITATGQIKGTINNGIFARNEGTDLTINTTSVDGGSHGIWARNVGSGALSITTTGKVVGQAENGIEAYNDVTGTDLTIKTDSVSGGSNGILVQNEGSGALSIASTGNINSYNGDGISASNRGTDLMIKATSVGGDAHGIYTENFGSGTLSITTTGHVNGENDDGIYASNHGTDLTVEVTSVKGGYHGINTQNRGSGALSLTATGHVNGLDANGIYARNLGTDLTIKAASVEGNTHGIRARNQGSGALFVSTTGDVFSRSEHGIYGLNYGTDLTIAATSVDGGSHGIWARNVEGGALSITATGSVIGQSKTGIFAQNEALGTDLTVEAASVNGEISGLHTRNFGTGITSITVNGKVTGGTGAGIETQTNQGSMTTVTLNDGANISSGSGIAINNNHGDSNILVKAGASVSGDIILGHGSDNLFFDGGTFSGTLTFDGGDDYSSADGFVDRLAFSGNSGTVIALNWEQIFLSDSVLTVSGAGDDFTAPEFLSLTNESDLTINGNFNGTGGQLFMDVDLASDDASTLTINGASSGTTTISVDAGKSGPTSGNDLTLVSVIGGAGAKDFALDGNPIGAYLFDLGTNGNDFFLTNASLSPETPVFEAYPEVLAGLNSLSNFSERFGGRLYAAQENNPLEYALTGYAAGVDLNVEPASGSKLVWARIEGAHSHLDSGQSTTGANFDINQGKMRVGMDAQIAETDNGLVVAGLNASYGKAYADIASASGAGAVDAIGTSIGASLTWLGSGGMYADAQAQYSWFSSDLKSDALGVLESGNDGTGQVLSLEIGQRFENSTGLAVTPQAQLVYSAIDFEDFSSAYGTFVSGDETDSLQLRAGVVVEHGYSVLDDAGHGGRGTLQAIANVFHEFREDTLVVVSGTPLNSATDSWTGEVGFGAGFTSADGIYAIHGNALVSTGLGDFAESYSVKGAAAVTISF